LVRSAGVEPTTLGFGNQYSIQLSYERFKGAKYNVFYAITRAPIVQKNVILRFMSISKPNQAEICGILQHVHSIAVVGLSPNAERPSFNVAKGMQGLGYRIIPVRPKVSMVLGESAYPDLEQVPHKIDLVDVFRAPEHVPAIVDQCITLGIKYLWLQDGVIHAEAAQRARDAGITVVMDMCIWRDGAACGKCVA
jgi:predicted CoA-binding protein